MDPWKNQNARRSTQTAVPLAGQFMIRTPVLLCGSRVLPINTYATFHLDITVHVKLIVPNDLVRDSVEQYDTNSKISISSFPEKHLIHQWLFSQASGQGPYFGQAAWSCVFLPLNKGTFPEVSDWEYAQGFSCSIRKSCLRMYIRPQWMVVHQELVPPTVREV